MLVARCEQSPVELMSSDFYFSLIWDVTGVGKLASYPFLSMGGKIGVASWNSSDAITSDARYVLVGVEYLLDIVLGRVDTWFDVWMRRIGSVRYCVGVVMVVVEGCLSLFVFLDQDGDVDGMDLIAR